MRIILMPWHCHPMTCRVIFPNLPNPTQTGIVDPVCRSEHVWKQHCTTMWHLGPSKPLVVWWGWGCQKKASLPVELGVEIATKMIACENRNFSMNQTGFHIFNGMISCIRRNGRMGQGQDMTLLEVLHSTLVMFKTFSITSTPWIGRFEMSLKDFFWWFWWWSWFEELW